MSDTGRTLPIPEREGATALGDDDLGGDHAAASRHTSGGDEGYDDEGGRGQRLDPIEAAQRPDNRAKLLLATTAMSLLSLLLLIWILAELMDTSYEPVTVDGASCVIELGDGETSTLYCRR